MLLSCLSNSSLSLLCSMLLLAGPLMAAPPEDKGKSGKAKKELREEKEDLQDVPELSLMVNVGISVGEARQLAVDQGFTGAKPLPQGIRKKLARGKAMPPGIAKTRMPDSFLSQLPRHKGYEWQQAGSDLVLVAIGSLIITEVLKDVFD